MNERIFEEMEKPEDIVIADRLIGENKYTESLQILKKFEKKENLPINHKVFCLILQARLLMWLGKNEECIKIAKKAYKEILPLGKSLLTVDILSIIALVNSWQGRLDKAEEVINKAKNFFETIPKDSSADYIVSEATLNFIKGFLVSLNDADKGIEYLEYSLSLWNKIEPRLGKAMTIMCIGLTLYRAKGALDQSIKCFEQGLSIAKDVNNKYGIAFLQYHLGNSYYLKGEFNRSLDFLKKSLKNYREIDNKSRAAALYSQIGALLSEKGDVNQSSEYIEKSLALYEEIEEYLSKLAPLGVAITLYSQNGNINLANEYLQKYKQIKTPGLDTDVVYYEALILKKSPRIRDKAKAEELLRSILEKPNIERFSLTISAIIHLCDIYLTELHITNNFAVLEDIDPLINKLHEIAKNSHSYLVLCETYILQARLALITLDADSARKLLTKGQDIAEKYDLQLLAMKISEEHDKLINQLNLWEELKKSKASLQERLKLSQVSQQFEAMLHKRDFIPPKVEGDQPILLIIITKNGDPLLYNHFTDDIVISENQIMEFLTSFHKYCDLIFSKTFDRVKLGEYTVLISSIHDFSLCYIFQGQTYSAQQKISHFCEVLNKESQVIEILKSVSAKQISIEANKFPIIESIINTSFMSNAKQYKMPFNAYKGSEPFVFVSYAHADKLEVFPIIDRLNKKGINIWYDEGIPVSENWKKSIAVNLEKSNTFLVFISPNIIDSEYVRKEISFALKKKKPFYAVYLKETKLPTELEFDIADIQSMMRYLMPKNEFYDKLNNLLKNTLIDIVSN